MKNYYNVLGFAVNSDQNSPSVTQDDIKAAYRRLASAHHPDKGGSAEHFQEIAEAYRVLSDPASRAEYDRTGKAPQQKHDEILPFLSKVVIGVLDAHAHEIDNVDMLKIVREHLQTQKQAAFASLGEVEKLIALREKAISKLKTQCDENILAGLIAADMKRQNMLADATRNAIAMLERALLILDDYSFDFTALLPTNVTPFPKYTVGDPTYFRWPGI